MAKLRDLAESEQQAKNHTRKVVSPSWLQQMFLLLEKMLHSSSWFILLLLMLNPWNAYRMDWPKVNPVYASLRQHLTRFWPSHAHRWTVLEQGYRYPSSTLYVEKRAAPQHHKCNWFFFLNKFDIHLFNHSINSIQLLLSCPNSIKFYYNNFTWNKYQKSVWSTFKYLIQTFSLKNKQTCIAKLSFLSFGIKSNSTNTQKNPALQV